MISRRKPLGLLVATPEECEFGDALGEEWDDRMYVMEYSAGFFLFVLYDPYLTPDQGPSCQLYREYLFHHIPLIVGTQKRWVYQRITYLQADEIGTTVVVCFEDPLGRFNLRTADTDEEEDPHPATSA